MSDEQKDRWTEAPEAAAKEEFVKAATSKPTQFRVGVFYSRQVFSFAWITYAQLNHFLAEANSRTFFLVDTEFVCAD